MWAGLLPLYEELQSRGVEVIYDDRQVSAGIMFSDADAIENDEYNRFHLQCSSTYCALKRIRAGQISLFGPFCSSSLHWREPNCA